MKCKLTIYPFKHGGSPHEECIMFPPSCCKVTEKQSYYQFDIPVTCPLFTPADQGYFHMSFSSIGLFLWVHCQEPSLANNILFGNCKFKSSYSTVCDNITKQRVYVYYSLSVKKKSVLLERHQWLIRMLFYNHMCPFKAPSGSVSLAC